MHVHFLGIGGTLMGNLALLALARGDRVTGSDGRIYPPMSEVLAASGIEVEPDWGMAALRRRPDLVVIGNARLPRGHASVEFVLREHLPYTSGAEWLGRYVLPGRPVIAVSGTHGKTTTTAMIAHILATAGNGPTPGWLIAGAPLTPAEPARLGAPDAPFVIEADEYDTSYFDRRAKFLHYRPDILVINNLEHDHADIYPDLEAIQQQFRWLLRTVPDDGRVITPQAAPSIEAVLAQGCWTPRETLAVLDPDAASAALVAGPITADWAARAAADGTVEVLRAGTSIGAIDWRDPRAPQGRHNHHNALAAIAASAGAGCDPAHALAALTGFRGVRRRMERIVERPGLVVYEDFAHHPTAIAAVLAGLRARVGGARITAVIDPSTHTMSLGAMRDRLRGSVADADHVVFYANPNLQWNVREVVDDAPVPATMAADADAILAIIETCDRADGEDHVVLMSNGAFAGVPQRVRERFPARPSAAPLQ